MLKFIVIVYVIYELYCMLFKKVLVRYLLYASAKGVNYADYIETEEESRKVANSFNLLGNNKIMINIIKLVTFGYYFIYLLFYVGIAQAIPKMSIISIIQAIVTTIAMIEVNIFLEIGISLQKPISTETMHDISKKVAKRRFVFMYLSTCIEIIFIYQLIINVIL